ncbi:hypothetical protein TNCV_2888181 [Trichonephila clavipes]|nr:hypothetical protein TNCV_2888181 [Trichonephila clavipes]
MVLKAALTTILKPAPCHNEFRGHPSDIVDVDEFRGCEWPTRHSPSNNGQLDPTRLVPGCAPFVSAEVDLRPARRVLAR